MSAHSSHDDLSPPVPPSPDALLVARLKAGEDVALAQLFERYGALVYGLALTILEQPQEAEDLSQEIFLSLWRNCTYEPGRGSLGSYLITLTRSRAIDRLRARGRRAKFLQRWQQLATLEPASVRPPLDQASLAERRVQVRTALEKLPPAQRQVLELAYFKGMSQSEIAELLDTPLGTVKSWARKGLGALKSLLQDLVG